MLDKEFEIYTLKEPLFTSNQPKSIGYLIDPITGCWNVISHRLNSGGYGYVMRNGGHLGTHRYSYELAYGKIPDGLFVCHHCDNPKCINPVHLFLGTQADNVQDAIQKGRMLRGETNARHKLTEIDVVAIRADRISSRRELGREYGVSETQISYIKNGKRWVYLLT